MAYYVALNTAAVKLREARTAEVEAVILEHEATAVLPVFTSVGMFEAFFPASRGRGDRISPMATYPFWLAEMLERLEANGEIGALVFNPVRTKGEGWTSAREPIPVANFVRFTKEIRPGLERLTAEHVATYGSAPLGSKAFAEATRRQLPQIHKIADDAAARMAEWDV